MANRKSRRTDIKRHKPAKPEANLSNAERRYMKSAKYRAEQRQKLIRRVLIISVIAAAAIIAIVVAALLLNQTLYGSIMTYNGRKISAEEFKLVYAAQGGSKQDALDTLTEYLTIEKAAADRGISLSEEDMANGRGQIQGFKENLTGAGISVPKLSDERLAEYLSMNALYYELIGTYEPGFTVDEDDYQAAYAEYLVNYKYDYVNMQVKYVITETYEESVAAILQVEAGMDVDDMIMHYSLAYDEETGIEILNVAELQLEEDFLRRLYELGVSDISEIIEVEGAYVFFIIESIDYPDSGDLESLFRDSYIFGKCSEIFNEDLQAWKDEAVIDVNYRAFNNVS